MSHQTFETVKIYFRHNLRFHLKVPRTLSSRNYFSGIKRFLQPIVCISTAVQRPAKIRQIKSGWFNGFGF